MGRDIVEVLEKRPRGAWLVAGERYEGPVAEAQLVELTPEELEALELEGDDDGADGATEGEGDDASRETARIEPEDGGDPPPEGPELEDDEVDLADEGDPPLEELPREAVELFLDALRTARAHVSGIVDRMTRHVEFLDELEQAVLEGIDPASLPSIGGLPPPGPLALARRPVSAAAPAARPARATVAVTNAGPRMRRARTGAAPTQGVATTGNAGAASTRPAPRATQATAGPPQRRRDPLPPVVNGSRGITNGQRTRAPAKAVATEPVQRHDDPTEDRIATAAPPARRGSARR